MCKLIGLDRFCIPSSGITTIEYLPVSLISVDLYELLSNNGVFSGNTAGSIDFYKAPLMPYGKLFDTDSDDSEQGVYYNYAVNGILKGDGASIVAELDRTIHHRYILRLTDGEGIKRLIGTLDEPFRFSYAGSKSDIGQQQNFRVKWSCVTHIPIYFQN